MLRDAIQGRDLIEAGTHRTSREDVTEEDEEDLPEVDPQATVTLEEYPDADNVKRAFK